MTFFGVQKFYFCAFGIRDCFLTLFLPQSTQRTLRKTFLISVNSVFSVAMALFHALFGLKKHSLRTSELQSAIIILCPVPSFI